MTEFNIRRDVMVDIETLGTTPESTIMQIAAASFEIRTGEILETFHQVADISQNEAPTSGHRSSEDVLRKFHQWLKTLERNSGKLFLWGNGILFDIAMIKRQLESLGLDYPVHYRHDRDVRTILELASHKLKKLEKEIKNEVYDGSLVAHDAFNDVINQVKLVSYCYRILVGEEASSENPNIN